MKFELEWAMPNKNTFQIKPIKRLLEQEMTEGAWADPTSRNSTLCRFTNDIDPRTKAESHMDAIDFLRMFESNTLDGVNWDPIYSVRQRKEVYEDIGLEVTQEITQNTWWSLCKKEIARIIKPGGKCISFGWDCNGLEKKNYEPIRLMVVKHGGLHNATLCLVEKKINSSLFE